MIIIGIAGGTGAGKTTLARRLHDRLVQQLAAQAGSCILLSHDSYYKTVAAADADSHNFDDPIALETSLLVEHLQTWRNNPCLVVQIPIYDFATHSRTGTRPVPDDVKAEKQQPIEVLIIEGLFVLADPQIRAELDLKIYVQADADIRLGRRMVRDVSGRGRSLEQVWQQYMDTVKDSQERFVEPSAVHADLVVRNNTNDDVSSRRLDTVATVVQHHVRCVLEDQKKESYLAKDSSL